MCDTFVVVHPEGVLFGKNSDRDVNEVQVLEQVPAAEHRAGAEVACTWVAIPQARRTHAALLSRPAWMWGAEMGVNEHGLRVGNEAVFTRTPVAATGLTGMDLVRLLLERAASAREAVTLLGALLQAHGQGGRCGYESPGFRYHSSFLIADAHEACVVETAGRSMAVEPVTSGVRAISNGLTIRDFARRNADPLRTRVARAARRRARVICLAAGARTPADAIAVLRDHGPHADCGDKGGRGSLPRWSPLTGAMGAPCMHAGGWLAASQTTASLVSWVGTGGAQHFATGTSAPCLSAFKPVRVGAPLGVGSAALWRAFEGIHRRAMRSPDALPPAWFDDRDALESAALADPSADPAPHWRAFGALVGRWNATLDAAPPRDARPAWLRRWWAPRDEEFGREG